MIRRLRVRSRRLLFASPPVHSTRLEASTFEPPGVDLRIEGRRAPRLRLLWGWKGWGRGGEGTGEVGVEREKEERKIKLVSIYRSLRGLEISISIGIDVETDNNEIVIGKGEYLHNAEIQISCIVKSLYRDSKTCR